MFRTMTIRVTMAESEQGASSSPPSKTPSSPVMSEACRWVGVSGKCSKRAECSSCPNRLQRPCPRHPDNGTGRGTIAFVLRNITGDGEVVGIDINNPARVGGNLAGIGILQVMDLGHGGEQRGDFRDVLVGLMAMLPPKSWSGALRNNFPPENSQHADRRTVLSLKR